MKLRKKAFSVQKLIQNGWLEMDAFVENKEEEEKGQ